MKRVFITALLAVLGALSFVGCDDHIVTPQSQLIAATVACASFGGLVAVDVNDNYEPPRVRAFCSDNKVIQLAQGKK